jgi:outer membrane protein OmpA-like peptidoglycan-associated protein
MEERGEAKQYLANYEQSEWKSESSIFSCRLQHEIPNYGKALFIHNAGEALSFELKLFNPLPPLKKEGELNFNPPMWRHPKAKRVGWNFNFVTHSPLQWPADKAQKLLHALSEGWMPNLRYQDPDEWDVVRVGLSPVQFHEAYNQYVGCHVSLLPVSFKNIAHSQVHFDSAASFLTEEAQVLLAHVVAYAKKAEVTKVELAGATDKLGSYEDNRLLANVRVEAVKNYLIAQGVAGDKISTKVYGSSHPIGDNKTEAGKAKNRRVEIKLLY